MGLATAPLVLDGEQPGGPPSVADPTSPPPLGPLWVGEATHQVSGREAPQQQLLHSVTPNCKFKPPVFFFPAALWWPRKNSNFTEAEERFAFLNFDNSQ